MERVSYIFHVHNYVFVGSFQDFFTEGRKNSCTEIRKSSKIFKEEILIFTGKKTLPLVRSRREKTPGIFVLVKMQWVKWHKSIHHHGLKKTDLTP